MKIKADINSQGGFTIIEVLVGAVVFMIGFSLLVFLLNQLITRQSIRDITTATHIASETMERAIVFHDTLSVDTTMVVSGISFRLEKKVRLDSGLASVRLQVYRLHELKELCRMYGEFDTR